MRRRIFPLILVALFVLALALGIVTANVPWTFAQIAGPGGPIDGAPGRGHDVGRPPWRGPMPPGFPPPSPPGFIIQPWVLTPFPLLSMVQDEQDRVWNLVREKIEEGNLTRAVQFALERGHTIDPTPGFNFYSGQHYSQDMFHGHPFAIQEGDNIRIIGVLYHLYEYFAHLDPPISQRSNDPNNFNLWVPVDGEPRFIPNPGGPRRFFDNQGRLIAETWDGLKHNELRQALIGSGEISSDNRFLYLGQFLFRPLGPGGALGDNEQTVQFGEQTLAVKPSVITVGHIENPISPPFPFDPFNPPIGPIDPREIPWPPFR